MNLHKLILTNNACYKAGRTITSKGIMVHSTGANNPNLKRYVGPDDGLLGKNQYNNHWNQDKPDGRQVCVHAFIGKLADGSIATYQTLPWNHRGWHAGGSANDTHIGFEICEDGLTAPLCCVTGQYTRRSRAAAGAESNSAGFLPASAPAKQRSRRQGRRCRAGRSDRRR